LNATGRAAASAGAGPPTAASAGAGPPTAVSAGAGPPTASGAAAILSPAGPDDYQRWI